MTTTTAARIAADLNKKFGAGTIVLGEQINREIPRRIPTGSFAWDAALGGGLPVNQWHEVIGEESHGKTAVVLKAVATNMTADPNYTCLWIAAEHLDTEWAESLGVDLSRLIVVERNEMEIVLQIVLEYIASKTIDMVVIDSLPALVPMDEDDGDMDTIQVSAGARVASKFFRKNGTAMKRSLIEAERACTGIIINQWREKIGVMYGDNRTTPGGRAKNFFYYTRTEVRRGELIKDDHRKQRLVRGRGKKMETESRPLYIGQEIRIRILKNKSAPPLRDAQVDFYFSDGEHQGRKFRIGQYDNVKEVISVAQLRDVLRYDGKWRDAAGHYEWRSRDEMYDVLYSDKSILDDIAMQLTEVL